MDGASASITTRNRASFTIAALGEPSALSVRLRSFRPGRAIVYLDDQPVAERALDGAGWATLSAELPAERLARGEHQLVLRFDRGGSLPGVPRAYLAVDWIRLGPDAPASAEPSATDGELPTLRIPAGWSVGYPMEVPAGGRLRGVLEGGPLEVWITTDGATPRRLARVAASPGPQRLDVPLAAEGEVARVELRAGAEATLRHPAVVTLDAAAPRSMQRPRNVLVYLIDTLRADRLRAYAPETRVRTPGISRFAERATVITSAHSQENWTKPSVATLLSSLLPWEHTAYSDGAVVPATVRLMPEMLSQRGFATAAFVANGYVSDRFGFQRGWDAWRNYIREGQSTRGERVVGDALAWLDARPADRPFFLYVHAIDPHVPYRPPQRYLELYDPDPYRGPVDFSRDATLLERIKVGGLRLSARDRQRLEALYDGEVSYQDAQLAALLDGLERRGLADDTMVVITADHGEEFWDHGSGGARAQPARRAHARAAHRPGAGPRRLAAPPRGRGRARRRGADRPRRARRADPRGALGSIAPAAAPAARARTRRRSPWPASWSTGGAWCAAATS
ncbi:MAG: sulfatase [Sandaracinaceae bacterium]|nr:sulfatase [Sandaracinaceae bacterium]